VVTSSFRSSKRIDELRKRNPKKYAAYASASDHYLGLAVDIQLKGTYKASLLLFKYVVENTAALTGNGVSAYQVLLERVGEGCHVHVGFKRASVIQRLRLRVYSKLGGGYQDVASPADLEQRFPAQYFGVAL